MPHNGLLSVIDCRRILGSVRGMKVINVDIVRNAHVINNNLLIKYKVCALYMMVSQDVLTTINRCENRANGNLHICTLPTYFASFASRYYHQ